MKNVSLKPYITLMILTEARSRKFGVFLISIFKSVHPYWNSCIAHSSPMLPMLILQLYCSTNLLCWVSQILQLYQFTLLDFSNSTTLQLYRSTNSLCWISQILQLYRSTARFHSKRSWEWTIALTPFYVIGQRWQRRVCYYCRCCFHVLYIFTSIRNGRICV